MSRLSRWSTLLGSSLLVSCMATTEPIRTVEVLAEDLAEDPAEDPAASSPQRAETLVVMLPGMGDEPEAYAEHGFLEDMQRRGLEVDVVSVDAHLGYYTRRELLPRLREDVFDAAQSKGYRSIWVVGISMGGLGALLTAQEFGDQIDGIVLLSPFLGRRPAIRRIEAAGGARQWQPPAEPSSDYTVELWRWLKAYATEPATRPAMFVAYGTREGTRSYPLLAELLPAERVVTVTGGHEWDTWKDGWARLLEADVFQSTATPP